VRAGSPWESFSLGSLLAPMLVPFMDGQNATGVEVYCVFSLNSAF